MPSTRFAPTPDLSATSQPVPLRLADTQATAYTPVDFTDKNLLISHLNEEHGDDLANFAQVWLSADGTAPTNVQLVDIYQEGLLLNCQWQSTPIISQNGQFLPFPRPIHQRVDFQQQYIVLLQKAAKKLGKRTITLAQQTFKVLDSYRITPNMQRLWLATTANLAPIADSEAGYAYLFNLQSPQTPSLATTQEKQLRYYTLRKAWRVNNQNYEQTHEQIWHAWVDIFLHQDPKDNQLTTGASWATNLRTNTVIHTEREFPEKIAHLSSGQALLIADETSLPTVARLLEQWHNPLPPLVLMLTEQASEHDYLKDIEWGLLSSAAVTTLALVRQPDRSASEQIMQVLNQYLADQPMTIEKVWGGLEASTTKQLRALLMEKLSLSREAMVLKVYWRKTP